MSKTRTWKFWIGLLLKCGVPILLGVILILTLLQRRLIYFPSKEREDILLPQAERAGLRPWRDRNGTLIGWRTGPADAASRPQKRLVVFHGNAGHALHRDYYVSGFHGTPEGRSAWEIYLFEYPGYGPRPGSPGEGNITDAARHAFQELLQDSSSPIYLLGESLGTGFASRLAAENQKSVSGLILVTPMTCLADVAASHYPFLPVRLILHESHDVRENLRAYPGPVAFLVAGRDEVMLDRIGETLYQQYAGRKKLWVQAGARHNTLDFSAESKWWKEVEDFLN
jgi:uncharacterized protein